MSDDEETGEVTLKDIACVIQLARDVEESASPSTKFGELLRDPKFSQFAEEVAVLRAAYSDTEKLQIDISNYVAECADEMMWNKVIRLCASIDAGVLCSLLFATAIAHAYWLADKGSLTFAWQVSASFIGLCLSAATALVLVVVRSAFQSYSERNSTSPVPDQLKEFFDQLQKITSGN